MVPRCLNNITYPEGEQSHICLSCDKQMKATSNVQPLMPYHGDYDSVVAGSRFLKAPQDIPQYVCTCCHQLLLCRNVHPFDIDHYDL